MTSQTPNTAATTPQLHPLHQTRLEIRLAPNRGDPNRPFAPGDVLRGVLALVNPNEEGVADVKHRLEVNEVEVKYFWEARSHESNPSEQSYYRGSMVRLSLLHGSTEDVLLMPSNFGGNSLEAAWAFEFTIPEKGTIDEASASTTTTDKGKAPNPTLSSIPFSGPPPSFIADTFHIEHIVEGSISFVDRSASPTSAVSLTRTDERGFKVGGEMVCVERIVVACTGTEDIKIDEALRQPVVQTIEVGDEGKMGHLQVSYTLPTLPLRLPLQSMDISINFRLLSPPSVSSSSIASKPKKTGGLFGSLGKGKEKKAAEEAAAAAAAAAGQVSSQQPFTIASAIGSLLVLGASPSNTIPAVCHGSTFNISSSHPTLSSPEGLTTTARFVFNPSFVGASSPLADDSVGSFQIGQFDRQFHFQIVLTLSQSHAPLPSISLRLSPALPCLPNAYIPPPPPTPSSHSLLPPSFDDPGHGIVPDSGGDHDDQGRGGHGGGGGDDERGDPAMMLPPPGIDEMQGVGIQAVGDQPPTFEFGERGFGHVEVPGGQSDARGHPVGGDLPPGYD